MLLFINYSSRETAFIQDRIILSFKIQKSWTSGFLPLLLRMPESNRHHNNLYSSSPESPTACLYIHTKLSFWTFKKRVNVEKLFVYVPDIPGKTHPPVRKKYNMLGNATFGFIGQSFHITLPNHICWFIWAHTHSTIIHANMGQSFYLQNMAGHITDKKWKRWCLWFVLICSPPSCFCGSISLPASDHLRFNFIFLTKKMHFKYEHKILWVLSIRGTLILLSDV